MNNEEIPEETLKPEYTVDISNLPKVHHIWVDRGAVMSCEGANHSSHRHFKVKVQV